MSVEETNKALVRRFVEAQAERDLDALEEMLAPDFVNHSVPPGQEPDREGYLGREGYLRGVTEEWTAFSDFRYVIEDQAAEGDKVITRATVSAIHDRGKVLSFAPTGREIETTYISIHRIVGGKIAEEWTEGGGMLELTKHQLEQEMRERERIEQELRVARRIQQASLPKGVPELEGWQITPYYQPAREVGGDFYEFFELEDGRVGVVVGDATGKGMPAALMAEATSNMLRAVAQALGSSSPSEVLARVNQTLLARIPSNMFVTCFYCILDPKSASLSYANAGHDLPYVLRGSGSECEELRARGMPLGIRPGMSYEEKETILNSGEAALLYSDGLVEAHNAQGEMFGFPRLRELVAEHAVEEGSLGNFCLEKLYAF